MSKGVYRRPNIGEFADIAKLILRNFTISRKISASAHIAERANIAEIPFFEFLFDSV